jgi:predicted nucleotidyltransferase
VIDKTDLNALDETSRWFVERLLHALRARFGEKLVSLVLYGSRARGTPRRDSDVDVLIVVDGLPRARFDRHDLLRPIVSGITHEYRLTRGADPPYLSYVVKTPEEAAYHSPLYLDMTEDAVIVQDRDGFFGRILDTMRRRMAVLGSKRIWRGQSWYWVLKPDMKWGESVEI